MKWTVACPRSCRPSWALLAIRSTRSLGPQPSGCHAYCDSHNLGSFRTASAFQSQPGIPRRTSYRSPSATPLASGSCPLLALEGGGWCPRRGATRSEGRSTLLPDRRLPKSPAGYRPALLPQGRSSAWVPRTQTSTPPAFRWAPGELGSAGLQCPHPTDYAAAVAAVCCCCCCSWYPGGIHFNSPPARLVPPVTGRRICPLPEDRCV